MPNLNTSILSAVPFVVPPLPIQRAIAEVLGALDDKIELNRRMNATLEELARTIFRSWFVDFDPVRGKAEGREPFGMDAATAALFPDHFVPSALGDIPAGWSVSTLGSELELAYGKPLKEGDRTGGPIGVFGSNGRVGWHNESLVHGPGIIIGRKGNPGIVTWSQNDFFPIDTTFYVVPVGRHRNLHYWYFSLRNQGLARLSSDSAVPGLNRNFAYGNEVLMPAGDVMQAFEETVKPMFDLIDQNEQQSRTLAELRDTLLPKLLSGEITVRAAEREVVAVI